MITCNFKHLLLRNMRNSYCDVRLSYQDASTTKKSAHENIQKPKLYKTLKTHNKDVSKTISISIGNIEISEKEIGRKLSRYSCDTEKYSDMIYKPKTYNSRYMSDNIKSEDFLNDFSLKKFSMLSRTDQMGLLFHMNHSHEVISSLVNVQKDRTLNRYIDKIVYGSATASYIQICLDHGFAKNVKDILNHSVQNESFTDALSYNIILHYIYKTGDVNYFKRVCRYIKNDEHLLDVTTFALVFQCLGKFSEINMNLQNTEMFLSMMKEKKITFDNLFEKGMFVESDYTNAKKAIERIDPSVNCYPTPREMPVRYTNKLLTALNDNLFNPNVESISCPNLNKEVLIDKFNLQYQLEQRGWIRLESILPNGSGVLSQNEQIMIDDFNMNWKKDLTNAYRIHKQILGKEFTEKKFGGFSLYPFYSCLDEEDLLEVMNISVQAMLSYSDTYSPSVSVLSHDIGQRLSERYFQKYLSDSGETLMTAYQSYLNKLEDNSVEGGGHNLSVKWEKALSETSGISNISRNLNSSRIWPVSIQKKVGEILLNLLINNATIKVLKKNGEYVRKPAFVKVLRKIDDVLMYQILPCPELIACRISLNNFDLRTITLPMLCPPIPWTSYDHGGYLLGRLQIFRSEISVIQTYLFEKPVKDLKPILDSLTQLGAVPWKINTEMLDIILKVFRNGGCPELKIPQDEKTHSASIKKPDISGHYIGKLRAMEQEAKLKKENFSLWVDSLIKLSIAQEYRDNTFWLPQSIDFRGRAYPVASHISPVNSDPFRSLLLFGKGKKLGTVGLRWLKIHVANMTGNVKTLTNEERLLYCEDNLDKIFQSADHPFDGEKWWSLSSDPWQLLAACKELTKALRSDSPEEYVSHLPIHQDGSCNGLQHYAALGRDSEGAEATNVKPSQHPQDVYSRVMEVIKKKMIMDIENKKMLPSKLLTILSRKTIKQTVMTSVYGVTNYGASLQINKQLKGNLSSADDEKCGSQYLTEATFLALKQMFSSAKKIQNWLTIYSKLISQTYDEEVSWFTPLGLPVVQPYIKDYNNLERMKRKPIAVKQAFGFPPNFIHSLDSTHMFLTALYCSNRGVTFAAIHDCYWTHACDTDILNEVCREQFAEMYSLPLLHDLKEYFDKRYPVVGDNQEIYNVPELGEFDINEVKSSTYFFS